jgi:hypothetical protein
MVSLTNLRSYLNVVRVDGGGGVHDLHRGVFDVLVDRVDHLLRVVAEAIHVLLLDLGLEEEV